METTVFNDAQLHLLRMMSYVKTKEELADLQNAISDYFTKKRLMQRWILFANKELSLWQRLKTGVKNIFVLLTNEKNSAGYQLSVDELT